MLKLKGNPMPPYLNIYYSDGSYEPSNKWFLLNAVTSPVAADALAVGIANASRSLQHTSVTYTRWEYYSAANIKTFEGSLPGTLVGTVGGEVLPFKYCVLIRLASTGAARPSVKYFHGISEASVTNGVPTGGFITDIGSAGLAWQGSDVVDSDGAEISGALFRSFTRRKKVRRIV